MISIGDTFIEIESGDKYTVANIYGVFVNLQGEGVNKNVIPNMEKTELPGFKREGAH